MGVLLITHIVAQDSSRVIKTVIGIQRTGSPESIVILNPNAPVFNALINSAWIKYIPKLSELNEMMVFSSVGFTVSLLSPNMYLNNTNQAAAESTTAGER